MAVESSTVVGDSVFTITAHAVTGLDNKPYIEYRLEERDDAGTFVGYAAMGSREFVEDALARRLAATL